MGDTPRPLKAFYENGDCSGNFVFQLPETGSYQVGFDPPAQASGLKFSLLASDDPMVDPGLKPDQISIDFGSFTKSKQMKFVPFGQFKGCVDDWEPSHWALDDNRVEFRIMQVAGYKKVFGPDSSMALLESTIKNRKMLRLISFRIRTSPTLASTCGAALDSWSGTGGRGSVGLALSVKTGCVLSARKAR
jgi:hypothetical protein